MVQGWSMCFLLSEAASLFSFHQTWLACRYYWSLNVRLVTRTSQKHREMKNNLEGKKWLDSTENANGKHKYFAMTRRRVQQEFERIFHEMTSCALIKMPAESITAGNVNKKQHRHTWNLYQSSDLQLYKIRNLKLMIRSSVNQNISTPPF